MRVLLENGQRLLQLVKRSCSSNQIHVVESDYSRTFPSVQPCGCKCHPKGADINVSRKYACYNGMGQSVRK